MSFSTTVLGRAGGAPAPSTVCTHATPVALGTNGTFVAPCSGTMQLYVNDAISSFYDNLGVWHDNGYFDDSGIFTANFFLEQTVGGVVSDTPVGATYRVNAALPTGPIGVPGPTLVAGKTYRYRASGTIVCGANGACTATADGNFSAWGGTCINSGSSCVVPAQFGSLVGVLNR